MIASWASHTYDVVPLTTEVPSEPLAGSVCEVPRMTMIDGRSAVPRHRLQSRSRVTSATVAVFRKYCAKSTRSHASTKPWKVHSRGIMDSG